MKRIKPEKSFRYFFWNNLLYITLPILLPLIIIAITIGYIINERIGSGIDAKNETAIESIATYLDARLNDINRLNLYLSSSSSVKLQLRELFDSTSNNLTAENFETLRMLQTLLYSSVNTNSLIDSVSIFLENRNNWYLSSRAGMTQLNNEIWYDDYLVHKSTDQMWIITNEDEFSICHLIFSSVTKEKDGIIVVSLDKDSMRTILTTLLNDYNEASALLINWRNGPELFHTGIMPDKNKQVSFRAASDILRWNYVLICDKTQIYRPVRQMNMLVSIMVIIATLIVLGISFFLARKDSWDLVDIENYMTNYINKFTPTSPKWRNSNLYTRLMDDILTSFMKINDLENELKEKQLESSMLELQALHAQLTPHFLYNTLETISMQIGIIEGAESKSIKMIWNLSKILRYALNDVGNFSTLDKELEITDCYLRIQEERLSRKIKIKKDLRDIDSTILIPKLIMQPLIENAFKYGLREEGAKLTLKIFQYCGH